MSHKTKQSVSKDFIPPGAIPRSVNFALGGMAGVGAVFFTQPLDLVKNRMQMSG
jgi:solute carrier family 25 oxoglutarate transporter 11